ncbi:MAG: BlaI/MecI/CopY family transcriptional regulator [Clostridiales bacterium]|nr:BlaI/MecI/CopY family transcriptional regulator [Clostridiales bacterium]
MKYPKLTECEMMVMKCIWDIGEECRVLDVMKKLEEKNIFYKRTTVATYLIHLKDKGYIRISREDKHVFYYEAVISYIDYRKEKSKNYLNFWYNGNVDNFLNDLI